MSSSTYFLQECPTCGRRSQVRVMYLGKQVVCQHCQSEFTAMDPATAGLGAEGELNPLLRRADELLASKSERRSSPR